MEINETYTWYYRYKEPGWRTQYSDSLRAGGSGDRIPDGARYSTPIQTGSGVHPPSCAMGTGSFLGVKAAGAWCWPHNPLLVLRLRKSWAITPLTLWALLGLLRGSLYLYYTMEVPCGACQIAQKVCQGKQNLINLNKSNIYRSTGQTDHIMNQMLSKGFEKYQSRNFMENCLRKLKLGRQRRD